MKKRLLVILVILSIILIGMIVFFSLMLSGLIPTDILSSGSTLGGTDGTTSINITDNQAAAPTWTAAPKKIVVLDPGHGKSSSEMSEQERIDEMWINDSSRGWGEWRHWKSGETWIDCEGAGCTGRAPKGGTCFYRMADGDRSTEPEINLNNTLSAKKYLEELGYEVRLTRSSNDENPSMTKRLIYCYPNNDTNSKPDADVFVCIHSNAGGGRGSAYMSLSGEYDQAGTLTPEEYVSESNKLGSHINNRIVTETSMPAWSGGKYDGFPTTILFCKSPIPIAYLEIGFFDNESDLNILKTEYDSIGKAIAYGIDDYFKSKDR